MTKRSKSAIVLYILTILSFIGSAISYFFMKGRIAIHWNSRWQVDHYVDKKYIFLIGAIPFLFLILYDLYYKIDPKTKEPSKMSMSHKKIRTITTIMLIILNWITVASGINPTMDYRVVMMLLLGISFVFLGNYMPTIKPNYFVGIRTPWALSNEYVFRKSNRFGGYVFIIVGIFMIISGISGSMFLSNISFAILILGIMSCILYSYYIYVKLKSKGEK